MNGSKMEIPEGKILVQFDGMCILCSRTIQLILKADRQKKFMFQTLKNSGASEPAESVIVWDGKKTYTHFEAILKIAEELGGIYKLAAVSKIIPKSWRHTAYLWVSRNRYRWFGVRPSCFLPTAEQQQRFL